jgi:hypothetical protein
MALTDIRIRNAKAAEKAYKLSDGGGLYLLVTPVGARYWRMDYRFAGKRRTLAVGVYPLVTLSDARTRREDARGMLANNVDPSSAKRAAKRSSKLATGNSFKAVACEWIDNQRHRLAPRYRALIHSRLEADIFPYIVRDPLPRLMHSRCSKLSGRLRNEVYWKRHVGYGRSAAKFSAMPS